MHTIGVSPPPIAAIVLRFTVASVSPNSRRRSEWPTITYSAPASFDHRRADLARERALALPVHSCAATAMFVLRAASATACTAVNGGATTMSTSSTSLTAALQLLHEDDAFVNGLEHLPVAGDQGVRVTVSHFMAQALLL